MELFPFLRKSSLGNGVSYISTIINFCPSFSQSKYLFQFFNCSCLALPWESENAS